MPRPQKHGGKIVPVAKYQNFRDSDTRCINSPIPAMHQGGGEGRTQIYCTDRRHLSCLLCHIQLNCKITRHWSQCNAAHNAKAVPLVGTCMQQDKVDFKCSYLQPSPTINNDPNPATPRYSFSSHPCPSRLSFHTSLVGLRDILLPLYCSNNCCQ